MEGVKRSRGTRLLPSNAPRPWEFGIYLVSSSRTHIRTRVDRVQNAYVPLAALQRHIPHTPQASNRNEQSSPTGGHLFACQKALRIVAGCHCQDLPNGNQISFMKFTFQLRSHRRITYTTHAPGQSVRIHPQTLPDNRLQTCRFVDYAYEIGPQYETDPYPPEGDHHHLP